MFDLALQDDVAEAVGERTEWLRKHVINRALSEQAEAARKAKAERTLGTGSGPPPASGKPAGNPPPSRASARRPPRPRRRALGASASGYRVRAWPGRDDRPQRR